MPDAPINLIRGDEIGSETDYRDALPVNMYAVAKPIIGAAGYMIQFPGLRSFGTSSGVTRGAVWNSFFNNHYRVQGTDFVSVDADGGVTVLGQVAGSTTVSMPSALTPLSGEVSELTATQAIIAGTNYYLYDPTNGFREVTIPSNLTRLQNPIDAVQIESLYIFTNGDFLYHTATTGHADIEPGNTTATFSGDSIMGLAKTSDNLLIVFGRYSLQFYQFNPTITSGFGFSPIIQHTQKIGIVGTHAKAESNRGWYIVGGRREEAVSVHLLSTGGANKIATREVEKVLAQYPESLLLQIFIEVIEQDATTFLIIHLPSDTLVFNETVAQAVGIQNAWTILRSGTEDRPWQARHGVFDIRRGEWVFGSTFSEQLGLLDDTVATQYGELSTWELYTPFTYLESSSIDELSVEIVPGHTAERDATFFVAMSMDGVTYGKETTLQYGLPSDYRNRFIGYRLGHMRNWFNFRFRGASRSRMAFGRGLISYG